LFYTHFQDGLTAGLRQMDIYRQLQMATNSLIGC